MYKLRDVTNSTNSTTTVSPVSATHAYGNATQHESSNDTPIPTFNSLQLLFMNALSICAMLPNVVFQFLNTLLQKGCVFCFVIWIALYYYGLNKLIPYTILFVSRISQNIRVLGTLFLMVLLFGLTEALVRVQMDFIIDVVVADMIILSSFFCRLMYQHGNIHFL